MVFEIPIMTTSTQDNNGLEIMNTLETLKKLYSLAQSKKQTLKSLRAEFIALCEADKELAAMEYNREWCSVGGNSVEQCKKTKGFDMFALHVNKIIQILEPVEFDIDWFFDDEPEQEETKPTPVKAYYTLVIFECGKYEIAFGDYDKETVKQESDDSYPDHFSRILKTDDNQAAIEKAVKELNGE